MAELSCAYDSSIEYALYWTRWERLKSVPYLRLKKRKSFFWRKTWVLWTKFFLHKKSHSAEKCNRGNETLLHFLTYIPLQNIKKLKRGPFGDIKNVSRKNCTVPKKNPKGTLEALPDVYVSLKKKRMKGGPFGHKFASLKWTDQCEDCSLKKKSHCYTGEHKNALEAKLWRG